MIYSVMKNLGNGDIDIDKDSSVSKSFTYDYLVITDHMDTPQYIYSHAKQNNLPVSGSVSQTGIKLKSISIQRWDQNNAKAVPSYHLPKKPNGSYALWKYQVTYSSEGESGASVNSGAYTRGAAQNFNASIKQYQQTSYMCYSCTQNKQPKVQSYTKRTAFIQNILKQPMSYQNVLKNVTVSFDFKISKSKVVDWVSTYIPNYVGSVNMQDVTIAELKLKAYGSKITSMSLSNNDQGDFATIHVQIQITIQKPVAIQVFGNLSQTAKPIGKDLPVRIHKWQNSETLPAEDEKGVVWFDRSFGLGNFSGAKQYKIGTDYQLYDKKVVLNNKGQYYKTQDDTPPDLSDPSIGKTYAVIAPVKSWKSLDLPTNLK